MILYAMDTNLHSRIHSRSGPETPINVKDTYSMDMNQAAEAVAA